MNWTQERNEGGTIPRARNHCGVAEKPNNVTCTFFCTVHLLPKNLRFEHEAPNVIRLPEIKRTYWRCTKNELNHSAAARNKFNLSNQTQKGIACRRSMHYAPPLAKMFQQFLRITCITDKFIKGAKHTSVNINGSTQRRSQGEGLKGLKPPP